MKARIAIEAEIAAPIEAVHHAQMLAITYLKQLGIKRLEFNSDGDALMMTNEGKHYGLAAEKMPKLDTVGQFPRIEAVR